jgi:uncharacterized membrane protein
MQHSIHVFVGSLPFLAQVALWLLGNLTLAVIPIWIANSLRRGVERDLSTRPRPRWWVWGPVAFVWLLFFPNTAYLLTEWRHYLATVALSPRYAPVIHGHAYPAEPTRDLVFLTFFFSAVTLTGLVTLVYALRPIDALLETHARKVRSWAIPSIFLLCSVGVYLGLVDRLNSWDPFNMKTIMTIVDAPLRIAESPWLATLIFSFAAFLWLVYLKSRRLGSLAAEGVGA